MLPVSVNTVAEVLVITHYLPATLFVTHVILTIGGVRVVQRCNVICIVVAECVYLEAKTVYINKAFNSHYFNGDCKEVYPGGKYD